MNPSNSERSELEQRFEELFSQVFCCSWKDYLMDQYPIRGADGKNYYIDYVYKGHDGKKIGIEVDGRGKFYEHKHVFNQFFQRQNAIQLAGITVYRFTWTDVVEEGGWQARKQLKQIFAGRLSVTAKPKQPDKYQQPVKSKQPERSRESHKEIPKKASTTPSRQVNSVPNYTLKGTSIYSMSKSQVGAYLEEIRQLPVPYHQKLNTIYKVEKARKNYSQGLNRQGSPEEVFPIRVPNYTLRGKSLYILPKSQVEAFLQEMQTLPIPQNQRLSIVHQVKQALQNLPLNAFWYGPPKEFFPAIPWPPINERQLPMVVSTVGRLTKHFSLGPQQQTTPISRMDDTLAHVNRHVIASEAADTSISTGRLPATVEVLSQDWTARPEAGEYPPWTSWQADEIESPYHHDIPSSIPPHARPLRPETIEYQPWPPSRRRFSLRDGLLILLGVGLVILWFKTQHPPAAQQAPKATAPLSEVAPASKMPLWIDQPPPGSQSSPQIKPRQVIQPAPKVVTQTVYIPVPVTVDKPKPSSLHESKVLQTELNTSRHAILPPQLQAAEPPSIPKEPVREPMIPTVPQATTSEPDEIVVFNRDSGIFHKPNSYWARKCTQNCIYIPKSQAIQMGGRASRADR